MSILFYIYCFCYNFFIVLGFVVGRNSDVTRFIFTNLRIPNYNMSKGTLAGAVLELLWHNLYMCIHFKQKTE